MVRPSATRAIERYRADLEVALYRDDLKIRRALGLAVFAVVSVAFCFVLVPLTLLIFINPISALGVLFGIMAGGCIVGLKWAHENKMVTRLDELWRVQLASDEYERALNRVRKAAATMRDTGVDRGQVSTWALSQAVDAREDLEGQLDEVAGRNSAGSSSKMLSKLAAAPKPGHTHLA